MVLAKAVGPVLVSSGANWRVSRYIRLIGMKLEGLADRMQWNARLLDSHLVTMRRRVTPRIHAADDSSSLGIQIRLASCKVLG